MKKRVLFLIMVLIIGSIGLINYLLFNDEESSSEPLKLTNSDLNEETKKKEKKKENISTKDKIKNVVKKSVGTFAEDDTRFVAVGDSLTQGVGDSTRSGGYIGILDEKVNQKKEIATFENYGHAGDRSDQLLKRLQDPKVSTALKKADVILVTVGANDIMKILKSNITDLAYEDFEKEQPKYESRLQEIFKKIKKENSTAEIYLLGFYNPFEEYFGDIPELNRIVEDWNSIGKEIVSKDSKLHYIPIKDLFENTKEELFYKDNFHPNDAGYEKMADRVLDYLEK